MSGAVWPDYDFLRDDLRAMPPDIVAGVDRVFLYKLIILGRHLNLSDYQLQQLFEDTVEDSNETKAKIRERLGIGDAVEPPSAGEIAAFRGALASTMIGDKKLTAVLDARVAREQQRIWDTDKVIFELWNDAYDDRLPMYIDRLVLKAASMEAGDLLRLVRLQAEAKPRRRVGRPRKTGRDLRMAMEELLETNLAGLRNGGKVHRKLEGSSGWQPVAPLQGPLALKRLAHSFSISPEAARRATGIGLKQLKPKRNPRSRPKKP
jgi:hypothetical protein